MEDCYHLVWYIWHTISDYNLWYLRDYLDNFETTEKILQGNFSVYDVDKESYQGLYGFLKDQLMGYFKDGFI